MSICDFCECDGCKHDGLNKEKSENERLLCFIGDIGTKLTEAQSFLSSIDTDLSLLKIRLRLKKEKE